MLESLCHIIPFFEKLPKHRSFLFVSLLLFSGFHAKKIWEYEQAERVGILNSTLGIFQSTASSPKKAIVSVTKINTHEDSEKATLGTHTEHLQWGSINSPFIPPGIKINNPLTLAVCGLDYIYFIIYELSDLIEEEENKNLCLIWHPKTIQWLNSYRVINDDIKN